LKWLTVVDEFTHECLSMEWFRNRIDAKIVIDQFLLSPWGSMSRAADGAQALKCLEHEWFPAIITDL